eukprot:COSAG01_NODE_25551_length_741_cov_0.965732_2_plen_80_part_01
MTAAMTCCGCGGCGGGSGGAASAVAMGRTFYLRTLNPKKLVLGGFVAAIHFLHDPLVREFFPWTSSRIQRDLPQLPVEPE